MDESESGQMVLEKVKWTFFMHIYDKQCEIMQNKLASSKMRKLKSLKANKPTS